MLEDCLAHFDSLNPISTYERVVAPRHGFEPRLTAPKAAVLPLDDRGIRQVNAADLQFNAGNRSPVRVRCAFERGLV